MSGSRRWLDSASVLRRKCNELVKSWNAPRKPSSWSIAKLEFLERDVRLRMPFRFGVVTLTEAPQAFVRARIRARGRRAKPEGAAAELLAPKWFDKNPALSNEDNFEQLRASLRARARSLSRAAASTPRSAMARTTLADRRAQRGLNAWSRTTARR